MLVAKHSPRHVYVAEAEASRKYFHPVQSVE